MIRVLIVEDTADIALGIRDHVTSEGFDACIAGTGAEAIRLTAEWDPGIIILDLMLPDVSGYQVLQQLRSAGVDAPVLILSAVTDEISKVRGFRVGADDYVTKPFGLRELTARLAALSRRVVPRRTPPTTLTFGEIEVQPLARRVLRAGAALALRPKELDLLLTLVTRRDAVMTRQELLERVWAYESGVESRTVDWHVAELRRKLGDDADHPRMIETVRKAGYRWVAAAE